MQMTYSKSDLKKLSSTRGLVYLLASDSPDFTSTLENLNYKEKVEKLQVQLNKMQNWIVEKSKRLVVILEGGEFAGKGEVIRVITRRINPRSARIVALPKPTKLEIGQWYFQRYINQLPIPGEMVLFDRSWYNRAVVEPVHGFCTDKEYNRFMNEVNHFESMLVNDGIIMVKIYLSISKNVQAQRIKEVQNNPLRSWELTRVDKNAQKLWDKYKSYERMLFENTNTSLAPWKIFESDDRHGVNLKVISHILSRVPYE